MIRERAPAAEIYAVKVFDRELATTGAALVAAIEWAVARGVRLINLSLGTTNPEHASPLAAVVDMAVRRGVFIVAAAPAADTPWLPGRLPGVIAVAPDEAMPRDECEVVEGEAGSWRVRASIYPRPIPGVPPERNLKGVSFAVANATALLTLALEDTPAGTSLAGALGASRSTSSSR